MFEIFQNKKLGKSHSTDSSTVCVCVCVCVCREYHGLSLYLEIFGSISIQESKCDHCLFKTSNGWSCSDAWKGCLGVLLPEGRACSHPLTEGLCHLAESPVHWPHVPSRMWAARLTAVAGFRYRRGELGSVLPLTCHGGGKK